MLHFKTKSKKIINLTKLILIIIFIILTNLLILKVREENVYSGTTKINDFIPDLNYKIFSNQQNSNNSNENELTQELVLNWLTRGENEPLKRFNARIGFIRKLAKYLNAEYKINCKLVVVPMKISLPANIENNKVHHHLQFQVLEPSQDQLNMDT